MDVLWYITGIFVKNLYSHQAPSCSNISAGPLILWINNRCCPHPSQIQSFYIYTLPSLHNLDPSTPTQPTTVAAIHDFSHAAGPCHSLANQTRPIHPFFSQNKQSRRLRTRPPLPSCEPPFSCVPIRRRAVSRHNRQRKTPQ